MDVVELMRPEAWRLAPAPRLILTQTALTDLRRRAEADARTAAMVQAQFETARLLLSEPPAQRQMIGKRMLQVSRRVLARLFTLGFAYRWTHDARFLDRAAREMHAAAEMTDWNPNHFLDVGEMVTALAFALDWLGEDLPAATAAATRSALLDKGLRPGREAIDRGVRWATASNNWNQVCLGGLAIGALAAWDDAPQLCQSLVRDAVRTLPRCSMADYAPDGVYPEGPMYWAYGTGYNLLLIDCLRTALGTDFGLAEAPGFGQTGAFVNAVTGPSLRVFEYPDAAAINPIEALAWFMARPGRQADAVYAERWIDRYLANEPARRRFSVPLLLWYRHEAIAQPSGQAAEPPLSYAGGGPTPVSSHRSGWDPHATWIAIKGGRAAANHGHIDVGNVVFEAGGVRWAVELGMEDYTVFEATGMDLWDMSQHSDRWKVFRLAERAHSIPLLDGRRPLVEGRARIIDFSPENEPFTTLDLTACYAGQAAAVTRTVGLEAGRTVGLIRDLYERITHAGELTWNLITHAAVTTPTADAPTAELRQAGRRLVVEVDGPARLPPGTAWRVEDLSAGLNPWDAPNPDTRKLVLAVPVRAGQTLELAVRLRLT